MTFPLTLRFKRIALAPQIRVTDATGALLYYVRQRAFTLREAVVVFADAEQTRPLYRMTADRVLDFSATYRIADEHGRVVGTVQRQGMRSLWRAHYDVRIGGAASLTIREENPWVKLLDGILGEIPVLGLFTGYVLHPAYRVARADGGPILRVAKQPALFESRYTIDRLADPTPEEETVVVLALLMMALLERGRG